MIQTKKIKWGLAHRIRDTIYINENLFKPEYEELLGRILKHEFSHSSGFTKQDFFIDADNKDLDGVWGLYYKFILKHPKSLAVFSPLCRYDNIWALDLTMTFFWISVLGIIYILYFIF
jgi:hypothetical protein